ncbi:MAG: ribokinase [Termitinemataceae bacterium]|nr:MAG: ribokinase [Termitinemataceae bacterium]
MKNIDDNTVAILGSINCDIVCGVENLPLPGQTVHGFEFQIYTGGKGANQATQMALLGLHTVFLGLVGDDENGTFVKSGLSGKGVDTSNLIIAPTAATGCALITVAKDGINTIVHAAGANASLSCDFVQSRSAVIQSAKLFVTQCEVNKDALIEGLKIAHNSGAMTILNPSPATPLKDEVYKTISYIIPNETESEVLSGISIKGENEQRQEALRKSSQWFLDRGVKNVCITLGGDGAYFFDGKTECFVAPPPAIVADTTAAGDSFLGGFVYGILKGMDISSLLRFANSCGSYACESKGAASSIGTKEQILKRYKDYIGVDCIGGHYADSKVCE